MGQIVGGAAKPKRCNLNKLSQLGTPSAGEHILVSSDNSMNAAGQGNFDCYIVGDGSHAATALELKNVETLIGVFDISSYHATGGVLAKYADLTAALNDGNNIPQSFRKGGMSVKFVQSSDNKYVQYRLMSDTFSTTESDWQGVDDKPTSGSDNLVTSGAVYDISHYKDVIDSYSNSDCVQGYYKVTGDVVTPTGTQGFLRKEITVDTPCIIINNSRHTTDVIIKRNGILTIYNTDDPHRFVVTQALIVSGVTAVCLDWNLTNTPTVSVIVYNDKTMQDLYDGIKEVEPTLVKTTQQSFTEEQKAIVRNNLGIVYDETITENGANPVKGSAIYPIASVVDGAFDVSSEDVDTTIERVRQTSTDWQYGVIASGAPNIASSTAYLAWKISIPYTGKLYVDPNNYGNVGTLFRAGTTENDTNWANYADGIANMPTLEEPWNVKRGDFLYVSIKAVDIYSSFIFQYDYVKDNYTLSPDVTIPIESVEESVEEVVDEEIKKQKIKIHYVSGTEFHVTIPQIGSDAVILHKFKYLHNEADLEYGDSQTAHVVTADIWNADSIWINNVNAIQGNVNFIYHNYYCHVGSVHGNEVLTMSKFLADGVEFNPLSSFDDIYCDVFRLIMSANVYKATTDGTPTLDENGHPIVDTVHTEDDTYRVNNIIDIYRNLAIKHDNTTFRNLHAGMLEGQASCFDTVTVCDGQYDTNEFVWNSGTGHFDITPIGESDNLYENVAKKASNLIMYGKGIVVKQSLERFGVDDYNNGQRDNYIYCNFYEQSNAPRLKIYQQPSITVPIDEHATREVFNNGDVIRCRLRREIEVNV